jgi:hypothetical protein
VHSFVVIPGKAALISLDRPSGSPAPAEARMDGVLVFYEPPHGDLVRYLEEIWRSIQASAAPIHLLLEHPKVRDDLNMWGEVVRVLRDLIREVRDDWTREMI